MYIIIQLVIFLLGHNYNNIIIVEVNYFCMCLCFPWHKSINYNYINNCFESDFCCQATITRNIPLRIIYVIISCAMVTFLQHLSCRAFACRGGKGGLDVASRVARDEDNSCRCRPFRVS